MENMQKKELLQVNNLSISFYQYYKGFKKRVINPISNLHVTINEGEIVAVVGASGSGKSLLAHAVLGILPGNAICNGDIRYKGETLTKERGVSLRGREITFIPQSVNYLDPLMSVGKQVQIGLKKNEAENIQKELFKKYQLDEFDGKLYSHELSGGMLRRVLFATTVRDGVNLIIADEPTPGIHPKALEEILGQLKEFSRNGAGVMLITHDIMSALEIADKIAVIKDGVTVEIAEVSAFSGNGENLKSSYTQKLWKSLPQNDFDNEYNKRRKVEKEWL